MEKILLPEIVRVDLGKIKVLVDFWSEKNRQIMGGRIIEGEVKKGALIEIQREGEIVGRGKMIISKRIEKILKKQKLERKSAYFMKGIRK
jgi:translation initiation factor IF-2